MKGGQQPQHPGQCGKLAPASTLGEGKRERGEQCPKGVELGECDEKADGPGRNECERPEESMKVRHVALGWIGVVLGASMFAMPSAMAQSKWQKLAQSETVTLYVNPRFMVKDGQYRRTLEMQDLKAPDADGVRSRSYLNEYDCESLFFRISQIKSYSGPGLTGRILFEVMEQGYWQKIQPNSLFAVGYVAACVE